MELKDKLKDKLKEFETLTEEINELLEELTDEPEEGKKGKIQLLDEYMKSLDGRLFVDGLPIGPLINLGFFDDDKHPWVLCTIDTDDLKYSEADRGVAPKEQFNDLQKYKYAFKGKCDELFKEEE